MRVTYCPVMTVHPSHQSNKTTVPHLAQESSACIQARTLTSCKNGRSRGRDDPRAKPTTPLAQTMSALVISGPTAEPIPPPHTAASARDATEKCFAQKHLCVQGRDNSRTQAQDHYGRVPPTPKTIHRVRWLRYTYLGHAVVTQSSDSHWQGGDKDADDRHKAAEEHDEGQH